MTDLEAIKNRRSRRSYTGRPSAQQLRALHELVEQTAQQSGLVIRLLEDSGDLFGGFSKNYGLFSGVNSFFLLAGNKQDENRNEKAGYYGQKIVLEATRMELGTCWVAGTFDRGILASTLAQDEELVAVITVGPVAEKVGVKERFVYSLARRGGKPVQKMYTADSEPPVWFVDGVRAAARAPSARNQQPVHFTWQEQIVTANVSDMDSYQSIDLGIAKLHFESAALGSFARGNGGVFTKKETTGEQSETAAGET